MSQIITRPVFWVIMVAMWALVFPLIMGAYNGIYLNTISAGTTSSERFDRVILKGTHSQAQDAWEGITAVAEGASLTRVATASTSVPTFSATTVYQLSAGADGACKIGDLAAAGTPVATDKGHAAAEFYTPSGNVVTVPAAAVSKDAAEIAIEGCEFLARSPIFGVFNGFVRVLMQVIALAGPLGFMLALAYFGSMLIGMATGHPVLRVVMVVILVLIGAILVNIVLPYIGDVFLAIDGRRFIVLDQELGLIAGLLRNFFGVIFVSGIIGSAWSIIGQIRGSGTSSASFQGSGM